jgi:hypothetical protein
LKTPQREFFVKSTEQVPCPCCGGKLKVIGSRKRRLIDGLGETVTIVIRRMRCTACSRVHHELPDVLVPYRRHCSESIESVVAGGEHLSVPADESTLCRWRRWFNNQSCHFLGCLISIATRFHGYSAEESSHLPRSVLEGILEFTGRQPTWLAKVVRSIANSNNWTHTRSAFLSR